MNDIRKKRGIGFFFNRAIPMGIGNFFLFLLVLYLLFVVGRSIWINYQSNKVILEQSESLDQLEVEIANMENEIEYLKTNSYREKEARAKLGYKASGENVLSLPLDSPEDKVADSSEGEVVIKTPNYRLWWTYFFWR